MDIMDSQAYSSSDPTGSDHRIVCAKLRLSVRAKKHSSKPRLNWDAITTRAGVNSKGIGINKFNSKSKSGIGAELELKDFE